MPALIWRNQFKNWHNQIKFITTSRYGRHQNNTIPLLHESRVMFSGDFEEKTVGIQYKINRL